MQRFQDWTIRLDQFLIHHRDMPFAWGTQDCCLFACSAIKTITGVDPAEDWRGKYDSRRTAQKLAAENKCTTVEDIARAMAAKYQIKEQNVRLAGRGDIICMPTDPRVGLGSSLGVVTGGAVAIPGIEKLVFVPMSEVFRYSDSLVAAWKIG